MMRRAALIAPFLMLALPASATAVQFSRNGSTEEDLQRDFARCRAQVAMLPVRAAVPASDDGLGLGSLGAGLSGLADRDQFMLDCMRAQGWVSHKAAK